MITLRKNKETRLVVYLVRVRTKKLIQLLGKHGSAGGW